MKVLSKAVFPSLFLSFLILCVFLTGCDALYRLLDKRGAEEKELVGEIIPHEINPAVEEIQTLLKIYGYDPGRIDGRLGAKTRNALARFQKDYNLKVSRVADKQTWQRLSVFKENGLIVEGDLNITLIQSLLQKAGFSSGKIDGKWGVRTKEAVVKFQEAHNLKIDGKVGYQTLSQIAQYLEDNDTQ